MDATPTGAPEPDDLLAEVEDRAANPPRVWDPEKKLGRDDVITDENVAGIVEEIEDRESGFGDYRVTVLRSRDGSRVQVAWFGAVLEQRSKNLSVGDAVALTFLGRVQPRDETLGPYANFDVVHRKPASGPRAVEVSDDELDETEAPVGPAASGLA